MDHYCPRCEKWTEHRPFNMGSSKLHCRKCGVLNPEAGLAETRWRREQELMSELKDLAEEYGNLSFTVTVPTSDREGWPMRDRKVTTTLNYLLGLTDK